jgi:uncharacterized BrkB/YihY/UPF0761 family membrane protein
MMIFKREPRKKKWRMTIFWVIGTACILLGTMIAGHLDKTLGVTDISYTLALVTAFVLILLGGFLWISVAVAFKRVTEE